MVEWWVQSQKLRAHSLCDYAGVRDPSWETREMLEAGEFTKRVAGLVTPAAVVVVENIMEAFSATYRPNLVSLLFLLYLLFV
jgi:hypothetical protein